MAREPREEDQVFGVVRETIQCSGKGCSSNRVADFQVRLASRQLTNITPCGNDVVAERIIHPLAEFVAQRVNVLDRLGEESRVVVSRNGIGLVGDRCAVVTEDAAAAVGFQHVVVDEERQAGSGNLQLRNQGLQLRVDKIDIDLPNLLSAAEWADGYASARGHHNRLQGLGRHWRKQSVVVRCHATYRLPEIGSLKSIDVLGGTNIGRAFNKGKVVEDWRLLDAIHGRHCVPTSQRVRRDGGCSKFEC